MDLEEREVLPEAGSSHGSLCSFKSSPHHQPQLPWAVVPLQDRGATLLLDIRLLRQFLRLLAGGKHLWLPPKNGCKMQQHRKKSFKKLCSDNPSDWSGLIRAELIELLHHATEMLTAKLRSPAALVPGMYSLHCSMAVTAWPTCQQEPESSAYPRAKPIWNWLVGGSPPWMRNAALIQQSPNSGGTYVELASSEFITTNRASFLGRWEGQN